MVLLGLAVPASAVPAGAEVKLDRSVGPPTSRVSVQGRGFGGSETIDVLFDGAGLKYAVTGPGGTFLTRMTIPASALPGPHTIRATGETSGLSARAPFTVRTDWPKFHFDDANSGFNPHENVLNTSNVAGLVEKWSLSTYSPVLGAPAVVGGVLYVGSENQSAYAINAATGKVAWRVHVGPISSAPAVANGMVYVASYGPVVALDASTGATVWTFSTYRGGFLSSPAVANGVVFVASHTTAIVYALDASTGAELWSFQSSNRVDASPAVVGGVVYICTYGDGLLALDASTGTKLWSSTAGESGSPAVANGVVYVGSFEGVLSALDAGTGTVLWTSQTGGGIYGSAAVAEGAVYVGSADGSVSAFDAATGTQLWSFGTGGEIEYSPAVANGVVYLMSMDNNLYALDAASGAELWSFPVESWFDSDPSPVVVNGMLYVGSYDWNVYAFGLP